MSYDISTEKKQWWFKGLPNAGIFKVTTDIPATPSQPYPILAGDIIYIENRQYGYGSYAGYDDSDCVPHLYVTVVCCQNYPAESCCDNVVRKNAPTGAFFIDSRYVKEEHFERFEDFDYDDAAENPDIMFVLNDIIDEYQCWCGTMTTNLWSAGQVYWSMERTYSYLIYPHSGETVPLCSSITEFMLSKCSEIEEDSYIGGRISWHDKNSILMLGDRIDDHEGDDHELTLVKLAGGVVSPPCDCGDKYRDWLLAARGY